MNTYNALGQRVEDITPASTTDEAYGAGGNLLLRYTGDSNSRSFVPFGGGILAEYFCGGMIFDHPDEIGSATTATDCTGNTVNEKLFYPFGESWTGAGSLGMHQEFAQLPDYDPETDQYNTLARHYSPMGRWMSPDPGGVKVVHPDDPQTWNMYAYARNNPTTLSDPSGLVEVGSPVETNGGSDFAAHDPANLQDRVQNGTFGALLAGRLSDLARKPTVGRNISAGQVRSFSAGIKEFYRHKCGGTAPHAGGQIIKLLQCDLWVYWSPAPDPMKSEKAMICAFRKQAGQEPFANGDNHGERRIR